MEFAQGIGPSLCGEAMKGRAHLGAEQRVVDPALGLVNVEVRRHDVVVAGEHDRLAGRQERRRM
jgi:hypothetical protein